MVGVCDQCAEECSYDNSSWRYNGLFWEHKCSHVHPQAGHCGVFIHQHIYEKLIELEALIESLKQNRGE